MDIENKTGHDWTALSQMPSFIQETWRASNFQGPTAIQRQAIPLILEGKDLIAESPTGTGKTIAYLLPLLHRINLETKHVQVVIVAPSRELVMQIHQEIQKWTKGSSINSASFIGGANIKKQVEKLKKNPQIIVGTTGRLLELIKLKKLKMHEVKTIVVDEFDMLIAQEHIDQIKNVIKTTLRERQLLFFSATLTEKAERQARELMEQPELIRVATKLNQSNVEHIYFLSEYRKKVDMLQRLARLEHVKALVFINGQNKASEIEEKLRYNKITAASLTGDTKKVDRQKALKQLRDGDITLLLATDVAARGLDIEGLTHVIHLDFPSESDQYIHRSGRTGRMGASGTVISIVTKQEESFLRKLSKDLGLKIMRKELHSGKVIDPES